MSQHKHKYLLQKKIKINKRDSETAREVVKFLLSAHKSKGGWGESFESSRKR